MIVHCFFEQSGTFKNEFKKLGYQAYDYDILNDFGETDNIIDLFSEIEKAYLGEKSLFDTIKKEDLIFAFFPCVRFTRRMIFNFTRSGAGHKKFTDIEKLEQNIRYFDEMNYLYALISKMVIVCLRKELKLIIENPYHQDHILSQFWHIKPKVIDMDRTKRGDDFKKPTQYWFINCEPKNNIIMEAYSIGRGKTINNTHNKVERSLINKAYAERFIKEFII
ncbi:MAG: hypothetical protein J6P97_04895 [Bacteroidales bacterium]|nr:hypothetical protein [Bacteroidales bacterium]